MALEFAVTVVCPKCTERQDTTISYYCYKEAPGFPKPCTECGKAFGRPGSETAPLCADCAQTPGADLHSQPTQRQAPGDKARFVLLCPNCRALRDAALRDPSHIHPKETHRFYCSDEP